MIRFTVNGIEFVTESPQDAAALVRELGLMPLPAKPATQTRQAAEDEHDADQGERESALPTPPPSRWNERTVSAFSEGLNEAGQALLVALLRREGASTSGQVAESIDGVRSIGPIVAAMKRRAESLNLPPPLHTARHGRKTHLTLTADFRAAASRVLGAGKP